MATSYTTKGQGDMDNEPICYRDAEPTVAQVCHLCGKTATAIIHHKVEGKVHVCGFCHIEASDADEIAAIPTVLL
jgi:hypothetical protein